MREAHIDIHESELLGLVSSAIRKFSIETRQPFLEKLAHVTFKMAFI